MKILRCIPIVLLAISAVSSQATAQLSLELRVSAVAPTADFLPRDVGYAGDFVWDLNGPFSLFAGYNWAEFTFRDGDRESFRSSGIQAGVKATLRRGARLQPWLRVGVVRNTLDYEVPSRDFAKESDAAFGPIIAAGFDVPLTDAVKLSPSIHRRSFRADINEESCGAQIGFVPPSFCEDFRTWGLDFAVRVRVLN
jgi:hypothetical protein